MIVRSLIFTFIIALASLQAAFTDTPMLSSKAIVTALKAREAIWGSEEAPLREAVTSLESLLNEGSFLRLDPGVQVDILFILTEGYERLERFSDLESLLLKYAKRREFSRYHVLLKCKLVRSYVSQDRFFEAEHLLSKLAKPSLAYSSLEEKTEIAKTITFLEEHLKTTLLSAETQVKSGILSEALNRYKMAFSSLEKYFYPFQASPVDKLRFHYALRLRIAELYYLLGDDKHASFLLADWIDSASACPQMAPLFARRQALLNLTSEQKGPLLSEMERETPEYVSWRAHEAISRNDVDELDSCIHFFEDKKNEEFSSLIHLLYGFRAACTHNASQAHEHLEKALVLQSVWTAQWKEAALELFAHAGIQRALICSLSHQEKEAQAIVSRTFQILGDKQFKNSTFFREILQDISLGQINKAADIYKPDSRLPSLQIYIDAVASYQKAVSGMFFEEYALKNLEEASHCASDAFAQLLAFQVDLLIRGGHIDEACVLTKELMEKFASHALTAQIVLACMQATEFCPGHEKEFHLFQEALLSNPLSPQALLVTFQLFDTAKELPHNLRPEQKDLLLSLQERKEARNLLQKASKSKEAGFIKDKMEQALALFTAARARTRLLLLKESEGILWSYLLSLGYEQLDAIEEMIASSFAFNELREKLREIATTVSCDVTSCRKNIPPAFIKESFFDDCESVVITAKIYSLSLTKDFEGAKSLINACPPSFIASSVNSCRGVLFAARALHESRRVEEALQLLSRLDETTLKELNYELALEVALEKSLCFREVKGMKRAMSLLAWIINSPCASSLRLKAMVVRADNYLATNREELARKQLEAVVEKGGEWGAVAERKLLELRKIHGTT